MKRAVFLDRDGVINKAFVVDGKPTPARTLEQVRILPHAGEAMEMLRFASFELVVVTNQPDVARGSLSEEVVDSIHAQLQRELRIEHFYSCFHDDADNCVCRKPKPGLLVQAAMDLNINLEASYMVGDRWRDVAAGQSAGCRSFFIDNSYAEKQPQMPYIKVSSLFEAAQIILEEVNDSISK